MSEEAKNEKAREEATGPRSENERTQKMREQKLVLEQVAERNREGNSKLPRIGNVEIMQPESPIWFEIRIRIYN